MCGLNKNQFLICFTFRIYVKKLRLKKRPDLYVDVVNVAILDF